MEQLVGVLGIMLIFGAIIVFHEFGHFIIAKLSGMQVFEFSIGFGPALLKHQIGDTLYAIRIIPLGGYVRIAGMEVGEEDSPRGYDKKPFLAKFGTLAAGATMNFVLAFLLVIIVGMAIGYPKPGKKVVIAGIMPKSPAASVGLQPGDEIVAVGDIRQPTADEATAVIRVSKTPVKVVVLRNGEEKVFSPTPKKMDGVRQDGLIYRMTTYNGIGVQLSHTSGGWERYGLFKSIGAGATSVVNGIISAFAQILSLVTGNIPVNQLSGPVGIMKMSYDISQSALISRMGVFNLFQTAAFLSLLVGFFNLLPIPALDGGRLMFLFIEGIRRKPMDPEKEARIHAIGMAVLLSLVLLVTIKDVLGLFGGK